MKNSNQDNNVWLGVLLVVGLALLGGLFNSGGGNNGNNNGYNVPNTATPNQNSFEHRYVRERFKQEGYSAAESKQAADAVIKFHEAQKARQR